MPIQKVILLDCFVNKNDIILFISFLVEHHSSYDICCEHMSSVCVCFVVNWCCRINVCLGQPCHFIQMLIFIITMLLISRQIGEVDWKTIITIVRYLVSRIILFLKIPIYFPFIYLDLFLIDRIKIIKV